MTESIQARRAALHGLRVSALSNAGLAMGRYINAVNDNGEAARELHDAVAGMAVSGAYKAAFKRWKSIHEGRRARLIPLKLSGPLAIGLGNESPTEIGITLQHSYGMPVIPGSAIKGLCARAARLMMAAGAMSCEQFETLFGDTDQASHFVFWDAWYDPATVSGKPLHRDVITVHHPEYYNKRGTGVWPTDFDDPIPIPFVVIKPGAGFLFALDAPSPEWADFAEQLLRWALLEMGAGAKTSAGYGRFEVGKPARTPPQTQTWVGVQVNRVPNTGELTATHERLAAWAGGKQAKDIVASLPDWAQNELKDKKKKCLMANVQVRVTGNLTEIVAIEPIEAERNSA